MITITYTNGVKQLISPSGSFYASVVEKNHKKVKLPIEEYRKYIMDLATDIAVDCTTVDKQCCPIHKIDVYPPGQGKLSKIMNLMPLKSEEEKAAPSYKKEQKKLRKLHKNDPLGTIFTHRVKSHPLSVIQVARVIERLALKNKTR